MTKVLPVPLLDLLSNSVILDHFLPYVEVSPLLALSATSKAFQDFVWTTPRNWRRLDLSRCKGADIPKLAPIDSGGNHWRCQRMDESLTEDEFYSGPLRGIFSKLARKNVLRHVQILILDKLHSVTMELIHDIIQSDQFNVKILSVVDCYHLNDRKLQALLQYICRPSRPEGTPRLKGLYFFGPKLHHSSKLDAPLPSGFTNSGITTSVGAQLGSAPNRSTSKASDQLTAPHNEYWNPELTSVWTSNKLSSFQDWRTTLEFCSGLISFDAILCPSRYHDTPSSPGDDSSFPSGSPTRPLATISLGAHGCDSCGRAPQFYPNPPTLGISAPSAFPLLSPPPSVPTIAAAVQPTTHPSNPHPWLLMSCKFCLANRWCEQCNRWWCHECYDPQSTLQDPSNYEIPPDGGMEFGAMIGPKDREKIKVWNGLCTKFCLVGEMMAGGGEGGMWG
ncbi:MAG: hypothetical protein Q9227_005428 [Pyrenula ochraceoflavens]